MQRCALVNDTSDSRTSVHLPDGQVVVPVVVCMFRHADIKC